MFATLMLTGIQWVYVFLGSAAGLYILYKLLPAIIGKAASAINPPKK